MSKAIGTSLLLLISFFSVCTFGSPNDPQTKTWCVAKPSTDEAALTNNLNYACSQPQVDCSKFLNTGAPCYSPDNIVSHASVAMNLYYQAAGRNYWNCDFKSSGLIVSSDPSYGSCVYQ